MFREEENEVAKLEENKRDELIIVATRIAEKTQVVATTAGASSAKRADKEVIERNLVEIWQEVEQLFQIAGFEQEQRKEFLDSYRRGTAL